MTTAARPTFDPAKGGSGVREKTFGKLTQLVSSRDLPAHLKLKERLPEQRQDGEEHDLLAELEARENECKEAKRLEYIPSLVQPARRAIEEKRSENEESIKFEDTIVNARKMAQLDADEDFGDCDLGESDLDDDDEYDDDPAELMAELNKIRQERLAEEEKRNELKDRSVSSTFSIKRRWDDDVPFKNCARDEPAPKKYINDTLRQDFHKKFMDKYIR